MSREIDFDKPLSDEDRAWLKERSQGYLVDENDRKFGKGQPEEPEVDEHGGQKLTTTGAQASWETGKEPKTQFAQRPYDTPVSGNWDPGPVVSEEDVEAQIEDQEARAAVAQGEAPPKSGSAGSEPEDDLDTWTVDELKDELRAHGESTSGSKSDLVKRLRKG